MVAWYLNPKGLTITYIVYTYLEAANKDHEFIWPFIPEKQYILCFFLDTLSFLCFFLPKSILLAAKLFWL